MFALGIELVEDFLVDAVHDGGDGLWLKSEVECMVDGLKVCERVFISAPMMTLFSHYHSACALVVMDV